MTIAERLNALRKKMRQEKIDLYMVASSDPHQSEYLPEAWKYYQYISGFSGSNAELLIGLDQAWFWTDGRYTEQAKLEVPAELFTTFSYTQGAQPNIVEFITRNFHDQRIGVDPHFISIAKAKKLTDSFSMNGNQLVFLAENLIAGIQGQANVLEHHPIFALPKQYTGESAADKLNKLRAFIKASQSDAIILNELTAIAWLLNLRGSDIAHSPLFFSYAMITANGGILFVDPAALSPKITDALKKLHIEVHPYGRFYKDIHQLAPQKVLLESASANQAMHNALAGHDVKLMNSPIALWQACKNRQEILGAQKAHELDAIALIRFFAWLNQHHDQLTEVSLAEELLRFRKSAKSFQDTSFDTIAGYGDHGAIIHYHADESTDRVVGQDALLLIDSGGQYLEGTTDVTRTIHLGEPTATEKYYYTLVLKGHLALKNAVFMAGTRGEQLDILARQFLWQQGLNYNHGTGHGVGAFLCVHEGPQRISTASTQVPLYLNMIVSNEPGIYLPGKFGIRIENLVYVKKANLPDQGFGEFYTFEDLTLVPYARNLIDTNLLTAAEITAIDAYHTRIFETLSAALDVEALRWLIEATRPL